MEKRYKLAVFDLDGTILDTLDDLADSVNVVLAASGYPVRTREEVRCFVGNGIRNLVRRALPEGVQDPEIDRVFAQMLEYYGAHCSRKTAPYPGVPELLRKLRTAGMQTAVLSNKADAAVHALCDQYFPDLFDLTMGEQPAYPRKPAPDSLLALLEMLSADLEETVYIGDSEVDVQTARNAGIDGVFVDWGFRDRDTLREAGAEWIFSEAAELEKYLL